MGLNLRVSTLLLNGSYSDINVFKYPYLKFLTLYKHDLPTRSVIPTILSHQIFGL